MFKKTKSSIDPAYYDVTGMNTKNGECEQVKPPTPMGGKKKRKKSEMFEGSIDTVVYLVTGMVTSTGDIKSFGSGLAIS